MLDTNICIALIRRKPAVVIAHMLRQSPGDVALSSITVAELLHGVAKSTQRDQNQRALDQFLLPLAIVDFDARAAAHYGDIRALLEQQAMLIGGMDLLIGAHARSAQLTLVTHNTREFSRIPGLLLEDWFIEPQR